MQFLMVVFMMVMFVKVTIHHKVAIPRPRTNCFFLVKHLSLKSVVLVRMSISTIRLQVYVPKEMQYHACEFNKNNWP